MSWTSKYLVIITTLVQITAVTSCEESPILNNLDLRSPETASDYWDGGDGTVLTDDQLIDGWYRTVFNGWQYLLIDSNALPEYATCSTYWPIYIKGNHTPVDQLSEKATNAEACIRDYLQPCSSLYNIQIRMCNGEVQYFLQNTLWFSAYCFYKAFQLEVSATPAPAPENVMFGNVVVRPELHFEDKLHSGFIWHIPYIEFRCAFEQQDGLFYSVTWYIDRSKFGKTLGPSKNLDDLKLQEEKLLARNISLGKQIQCGVSASATFSGLQTSVTFSALFYAGIKILNTTIFLDKQSSATVQMVSSVPIGCYYFKLADNKPPKQACKTEMKLFVDDSDPLQCERGSVLNEIPSEDILENQMCSKYVKTLTKDDEWNPDTPFNFSIVTSDHNYNDKSRFILKLQFPETIGHKIWKDYLFPDITVFVQNMTLYQSKVCKSRNDPHMTTFDGYNYEQQITGTYIMYQHQQNGIEVQQTVKPCGSRAKCTCGVAVAAGQDIFMINRCSTKWFIGFTQCGDGGILQVVRVNDFVYRVFTPIGTRVEISLDSRSDLMNVQIFLAPKDVGNVLGLCGKADGNITNDLQHRDSNIFSIPRQHRNFDVIHEDFILSWKVEDDSEENLFNPTFKTRQEWRQQNGLYCVCKKERSDIALCSSSQYLNCLKPNSITKVKCHINGRRKRSAGNRSDKEIRRLLTAMARSGERMKRQDTTTLNITSESIQICDEKIHGSLALREYKNISANEDTDTLSAWCAFDISNTNDTVWADVHVEAVNEGVKNMIDLQPDYVANNTEAIDVFLKKTCPFNCTDRGICSDEGICLCFQYFRGPDCSIDERDALNIRDIQGGGECDLADGDDCECFYVLSDRIQENFTCAVNTSKILINGDVELVSTDTIKGGFEDIFTGICCVPENIIGLKDVFVAIYDVSISNSGNNFGNKENVYVFDTKCQLVQDTPDNTKVFSLKVKHCFIDGYCFSDDEMAPTGCLACNSSISTFNWTEYNPCQNGGICRDESNGYTCLCIEGYGGINCEYEINECDSAPCQNGGNCTDEFNGYTCTCMDGFAGTHCELNIDECASQPCKNGGMCNDQINQYECMCNGGYEGSNCETESDECSSNPCQNQGTCNDNVNGYTCTCTSGYFGINCQTNINDCVSNPCQNRGTCVDVVDGRMCTCLEGYNGVNCEININECHSNPCRNGGSCADAENMYTCSCISGYTGPECETEINECSSSPCTNGGSCVDEVNGFKCTCALGYTGVKCETEINECSSSPCKNGGTCFDVVNGFKCNCTSGFTGEKCELEINECSSSPCVNGGSCVDQINGFKCNCASGYTGEKCETEINECSSSPCVNGGSCVDQINGFQCNCVSGYTGEKCETEINECSSSPCVNGGSCVDQINGFQCNCVSGYTGEKCVTEINECSSSPCVNGGSCVDQINGFKCNCVSGYTGEKCETEINECSPSSCTNGGNCVDEVNGFTCNCPPGYTGEKCETEINECSSSPCANGGSCVDEVNGFKCTCTIGYTGVKCEIEINECSSSPCKNGGTCFDVVNGFKCNCTSGFTGEKCELEINECSSSPCVNGGSCVNQINGFKCNCVSGYTGEKCKTEINECSSSPCVNGGSCVDQINGFKCNCVSGYTGVKCGTEINECSSSPCVNGGSCVDQMNGFKCTCVSGYSGEKCETEINKCSSSPCLNDGSCVDEVNAFKCICASGYTGERCEQDLDECSSNKCQNGGTCVDGLNTYGCYCVNGYTGVHCETDVDECSSTPCVNGGSCEDKINGYLCKCVLGYFGINCQTDIDDCQSNPCLNGGSCMDIVNGRECNCSIGFEGKDCETNIDECSPNPCQNGGICADGIHLYTCTCADGYKGENCEIDIDECSFDPCENGGSCADGINKYTCTCAAGYTGIYCETEINECLSSPCKHNGSCVDQENGFRCNCASGYTGEKCETEINECSSSPCINGGSCVDDVNRFRCNCASGYTGEKCETDFDECASVPCLNGGNCEDKINSYICRCAAGYIGVNCQTDVDECFPNPCLNGGKCEDGVNRYLCTCDTGFEGTNCETDIEECSPNPCQNGGSCVDGINDYKCLCAIGFAGVDCEISNASSSRISLVFPVTVNNVFLSDLQIQQNIRMELIQYFQGKLGQFFKDITVLQLRVGSLIVDFVINYENDSTAAIKLATATSELVSGKATIELLNETVSATALSIDDITVTTEALKESEALCKIYTALNGECANNFRCVVEDRTPACVPTQSTFGITLLIVVIVCPLVFLILVSAAVYLSIRMYRARQRKMDIKKRCAVGYDGIHSFPHVRQHYHGFRRSNNYLHP